MTMPWAADLEAARTLNELSALWARHRDPATLTATIETLTRQGIEASQTEVEGWMGRDWEIRAAEIRAGDQTGPSTQQVQTAREKLDEIDTASLQATHDYADALSRFAKAHAHHRRIRAKKYLAVKAEHANAGEKITNGEADMITDADDEVSAAYLESEIAEALVRAGRARIDHLSRSFEYHRSLYVRESRVDGR